MTVIFNFPDFLTFKVNMDIVPRTGEQVKLLHITYKDFKSMADFEKYKDRGYDLVSWMVGHVLWAPRAEESYVNIHLEKIPRTAPKNN